MHATTPTRRKISRLAGLKRSSNARFNPASYTADPYKGEWEAGVSEAKQMHFHFLRLIGFHFVDVARGSLERGENRPSERQEKEGRETERQKRSCCFVTVIKYQPDSRCVEVYPRVESAVSVPFVYWISMSKRGK